jgi:hypothetical protein
VKQGQKLERVLMIYSGKARVEARTAEGRLRQLYVYQGGEQGSIVGGSALLDPSVRAHNYPQSVIVDSKCVVEKSPETNRRRKLMYGTTEEKEKEQKKQLQRDEGLQKQQKQQQQQQKEQEGPTVKQQIAQVAGTQLD